MQVRRVLDAQNSTAVKNATDRIDAQAKADKVSETPTLFLGKTGSKLSPVSSKATFDEVKLAAAIRSNLGELNEQVKRVALDAVPAHVPLLA